MTEHVVPASDSGRGAKFFSLAVGETRTFTSSYSASAPCGSLVSGTSTTTVTLEKLRPGP